MSQSSASNRHLPVPSQFSILSQFGAVCAACRSPSTILHSPSSRLVINRPPAQEQSGVEHRLAAAWYAREFFPEEEMAAKKSDA
jgi:hypothetical protein